MVQLSLGFCMTRMNTHTTSAIKYVASAVSFYLCLSWSVLWAPSQGSVLQVLPHLELNLDKEGYQCLDQNKAEPLCIQNNLKAVFEVNIAQLALHVERTTRVTLECYCKR